MIEVVIVILALVMAVQAIQLRWLRLSVRTIDDRTMSCLAFNLANGTAKQWKKAKDFSEGFNNDHDN